MKIIYLLSIFCFLLLATSAMAQTMSNSSYILRMGNLNSVSGNVSGPSFKLGFTSGEQAPGLYSGANFKVRLGFQYIKAKVKKAPFSFSISETFIDFGVVSPTNPISRTNTLTVSSGTKTSYTVTVSQDHPLKSQEGNTIPDTSCDNGDCSSTKASLWQSSLAYGLGFRCDNLKGSDCSSSFLVPQNVSSAYKSFPTTPSSVTVMEGTAGLPAQAGSSQGQITYKLNVSPTQPAGLYRNSLTYIATPAF